MTSAFQAKPPAAFGQDRSRAHLLAAAALFTLALAVRAPLIGQSLWYDEMYTMLHYAGQPLGTILTDFSPNNHPLYSLLARASMLAGGLNDTALRLPAILAGALLPLALAWPLRRSHRGLAVVLGLLAAVQPWLAAFSIEGRGYTLLLLLSVLATQRLAAAAEKIDGAYILLLAAAVYTIPVGVAVAVGHGVVMVILRRRQILRWLANMAIAAAIIGLLYLPFLHSMLHYRAQMHRPSLAYGQFLAELPRYLLLGWSPQESQWLAPRLPWAVAWLVVAGVTVCGAVRAWRQRVLLAEMITFAVASLLALSVPLLLPDAGEVRFAAWLIPLFVMSLALLLAGPPSAKAASLPAAVFRRAVALLVIALSATGLLSLWRIPAQDVWQGIAMAEEHAARSGGTIIGVYLGADEARSTYEPQPPMLVVYDLSQLQRDELERPGPFWAIVFYPELLRRDQGDLARHIQANYALIGTFPGRVSPVLLYVKR